MHLGGSRLSLGGCALTPPVTIRLTSRSGPVYIRGQHVIGQNVCKSEEENNSSPIKRPFKHETSTSVHPVKKLKVLQYDDVSETDSDHDEDEDDGSDVCEVPMPPPEVIDLTAIDGEESSRGLSTSDDESSSRRSPTDIIQKLATRVADSGGQRSKQVIPSIEPVQLFQLWGCLTPGTTFTSLIWHHLEEIAV
ncbi:nucleophosmin-like [Pleurodeles waltl]|uniref:nucleophosmin-like n=1 Tax=Pleurodeles waltl TaxID=8319 RepID=UPI0037094785